MSGDWSFCVIMIVTLRRWDITWFIRCYVEFDDLIFLQNAHEKGNRGLVSI